ncbi:hypothetical protein D8674_011496 [Pyrus ussuriensis x Pyrus communis]|uniref:Uncharacterized protein n=1 Tax=Pyrus ussuriensis x Pyrus communis TaxID=2448454 RepID=A0A5N5FYW9_9ROSA|nr:hypothetical protein D8674_011496 [Pyrus ussuriensis x Pyrus communis]
MLSKEQVFLAPCFTFSSAIGLGLNVNTENSRLVRGVLMLKTVVMEDKNRDQSVPVANSNDLRQHFKFAHAIVVAIGDNCPTAEWCSWKDVPQNVKKAMMDELLLVKLMEDALEGGYNQWHYEVGPRPSQ